MIIVNEGDRPRTSDSVRLRGKEANDEREKGGGNKKRGGGRRFDSKLCEVLHQANQTINVLRVRCKSVTFTYGTHCGLVVVSVFRAACVVFLGKTLFSHGASLYPGV